MGASFKRYESRRNLLGSVFAEGGLPFKLLSEKQNSRFSQVMHSLLAVHDDIKAFGEDFLVVARKYISGNLPQAFSEDESVELVVMVVERLMSLANTYQLGDQKDPAKYLDTQLPAWRNQFPIPLDIESGTAILNGLLHTASDQEGVSRKQSKSLSCEHRLLLPEMRLKTECRLPERFRFKVASRSDVSQRVDLFLFEGDKQRQFLGPGFLYVEADEAVLRVTKQRLSLKRDTPEDELSVSVMSSGSEIYRYMLPGSEVYLNEVPVGFSLQSDYYQFIGQASFNTKYKELLVSAPGSLNPSILLEQSDLTGTGNLNLFKVSSDVSFQSGDGDSYQIKLAAEKDYIFADRLDGRMLEWPTKPKHTFIGMPKCQQFNSSDGHSIVPELYIGKQRISDLDRMERYGCHTLSVKNANGNILSRRRVAVLPASFTLSFETAVKPYNGCLVIQCDEQCIYGVKGEGVSVKRENSSDSVRFHLSTQGAPPADIVLSVQPNLLSDPIEITLPYPATGTLVFDNNGLPLSQDITTEQLLGSRIHLYSSDDSSMQYCLDVELVTYQGSASRPIYSYSYKACTKPLVLSLHGFKEQINTLMSLSSSLDATVRIRISGRKTTVINVHRYRGVPAIDDQNSTLAIMESYTKFAEVKNPIAMLLSAPERRPVALDAVCSQEVKTGTFSIPEVLGKDGPWLIMPDLSEPDAFRASVFLGIFKNNH